jgi:hypothetical protein
LRGNDTCVVRDLAIRAGCCVRDRLCRERTDWSDD